MKITLEPPKLKTRLLLLKKRPATKIIPEKLNGFAMKISHEPPKLRTPMLLLHKRPGAKIIPGKNEWFC